MCFRKSDICFYFSITKEENSDFDDNLASQPNGDFGGGQVIGPSSTGTGANEGTGESEKVTINCTASTPLLGGRPEGFGGGSTMSGGLNPPGSGVGKGEGFSGSSFNLSSSPKEGPGGSAGLAMQYLNQMAKPMESNLLLPPNLSMRRGKGIK